MSLQYSPDRYAIAAQEDRCAPRTRLQIPATLRPSGDRGFSTNVLGLSLAGFSCHAATGLRPGAPCSLPFPALSALQAEVAWNNGSMVGCAFADLLNPAVLGSIIARYA